MALTPSQVEHYRRRLVARRDELASGTARAEAAVAAQAELGTLEDGDRATANVAKEDLLQEAGRDSDVLWQIETALVRIVEGKYAICDVCGQEIPPARLDAVPWALLCVRDQEISDRKRGVAGSKSGGASGAVSGGAPSRVVL